MTDELIKRLRWQEVHNGAVYLYGSRISFSDEAAIFKNPRLASGKPILQLVSRTNYQGNRYEPELPVLIPNHTYRLDSQIETIPEQRFLIQVDFLNRQGELIAFEVLRNGQGEFTCPADGFSYTITVISAGCESLTFKEMSLYQKTHEGFFKREKVLAKCYSRNDLPSELNIVKNLIKIV